VSVEKLFAARDLLVSTRRTLQLVDEEIAKVKEGRVAVETASDVSSEHRVAWFGATDDNDRQNGIQVFTYEQGVGGSPTGFGNPYRGTIRVQEDAAFVCTRVMVALRSSIIDDFPFDDDNYPEGLFLESPQGTPEYPFANILIRLVDGNTGRNLTPGITTGPFDRDRGAVPLSFLSSFRFGLGSNFKNSIFSEFTLPRASTVRVEAYNMAPKTPSFDEENIKIVPNRLFLSLYGYKVYGA
jgi:hypothetical protein